MLIKLRSYWHNLLEVSNSKWFIGLTTDHLLYLVKCWGLLPHLTKIDCSVKINLKSDKSLILIKKLCSTWVLFTFFIIDFCFKRYSFCFRLRSYWNNATCFIRNLVSESRNLCNFWSLREWRQKVFFLWYYRVLGDVDKIIHLRLNQRSFEGWRWLHLNIKIFNRFCFNFCKCCTWFFLFWVFFLGFYFKRDRWWCRMIIFWFQ